MKYINAPINITLQEAGKRAMIVCAADIAKNITSQFIYAGTMMPVKKSICFGTLQHKKSPQCGDVLWLKYLSACRETSENVHLVLSPPMGKILIGA